MRYLLAPRSRAILTRLAEERTLCALDFDGTLSPIVARPDVARMRLRTRKLLGHVATLYPCVVVSGRARSDLVHKLDGVKLTRAIGNHGAETELTQRKPCVPVEQWKIVLARELGSAKGIQVEDKGLSLAVHYRNATHKSDARRRILAATRGLQQVRVLGGKQVVNLMMANAPTKGQALKTERNRLGCNWVLYVGDDENDEDAFAIDGNMVSVRIGRKRQSRAQYYLRTQPEIDQLLEQLVSLRQR